MFYAEAGVFIFMCAVYFPLRTASDNPAPFITIILQLMLAVMAITLGHMTVLLMLKFPPIARVDFLTMQNYVKPLLYICFGLWLSWSFRRIFV